MQVRQKGKEKTITFAFTAKAKLRIVPADYGKMGALIDQLGNAMLGEQAEASGEAMCSLSSIDDDRVVPLFRRAVEAADNKLTIAALNALARFSSDEALAVLAKAAARQADDIRHAAACALAESPHRDAKKILLSMWEDSYYAVRIDVVHALGEMDTPQSLELLKTMSHDPEIIVRDEAMRYLNLRRTKSRVSGQVDV